MLSAHQEHHAYYTPIQGAAMSGFDGTKCQQGRGAGTATSILLGMDWNMRPRAKWASRHRDPASLSLDEPGSKLAIGHAALLPWGTARQRRFGKYGALDDYLTLYIKCPSPPNGLGYTAWAPPSSHRRGHPPPRTVEACPRQRREHPAGLARQSPRALRRLPRPAMVGVSWYRGSSITRLQASLATSSPSGPEGLPA